MKATFEKTLPRARAALACLLFLFGWLPSSSVLLARPKQACVMACSTRGVACCCTDLQSHKTGTARDQSTRHVTVESNDTDCPAGYLLLCSFSRTQATQSKDTVEAVARLLPAIAPFDWEQTVPSNTPRSKRYSPRAPPSL